MNSTNTTTCQDWFPPYCQFHQRDASKIAILVLAFAMIVLTMALFYTIIWYEKHGADNKRILTNKLVSAICWNAAAGGLLAYFSDTATYLFAPMPKSVCLFFAYARMTIASNILMFLNIIVISKYIFIFWMKNPGSVQDDFWMLVVSLWTCGFSMILNFVRVFLPRRETIYYYICLDQDPSVDQHLDQRKDEGLEIVACVVLHIVVSLRVKLFQKKIQPPAQQGKVWYTGRSTNKVEILPPTDPTKTWMSGRFKNHRTEKISLADFVTNFVLVCWIIILSVMLSKVTTMTVNDISSAGNSFYLFCFLYYANSVSGLVISGAEAISNISIKKVR